MSGAAPTPNSRGRRRALDAAINLVPFIDLLSCCIAFLLITACWSQLARIETRRPPAGGDPGPETAAAARPKLTIGRDGYWLERGGATIEIPRRGGDYDLARLAELLAEARRGLPDEAGLSLRAQDGVAYRELVRTLDTVLAARFADVDVDGV